jgi:FkbM family methyltransferase
MVTTQGAKRCFINARIGNESELYRLFNKTDIINIADIGACDGLSSVHYAKMFPCATIHAFEPLPQNCAEMQENFAQYCVRHEIYQYALSDKSGMGLLWESHGQHAAVKDWNTGNKSSSLLQPKGHIKAHPWCKFRKRRIRTCRLDDVHADMTFHFAHIDVQGAEMAVLLGGEKVFARTRAFWVEVAKTELYAGQPMKNDIVAYMAKIGCKCTLDTCQNDAGDMFFVRG